MLLVFGFWKFFLLMCTHCFVLLHIRVTHNLKVCENWHKTYLRRQPRKEHTQNYTRLQTKIYFLLLIAMKMAHNLWAGLMTSCIYISRTYVTL